MVFKITATTFTHQLPAKESGLTPSHLLFPTSAAGKSFNNVFMTIARWKFPVNTDVL